ncbi:MAG: hypothetical protein ACE15B_10720 [Bryobacteraceae bacterium]
MNRAAYRGYFQHDDFNHLGWTTKGTPWGFVPSLASPRFYLHNYRPAVHMIYSALGRTAGIEFGWYVALIHLAHLAATALLWLLLRRLGFKPLAAFAAVLVFVFHAAAFDIYWRPAYLFDLMCLLFSLAALLSYASRRWVLCFVCCWLAYKSKEIGVMTPVVITAYEYLLGERNWKRVAPFAAISLLFGIQGLLGNPYADGDYAFRFTPAALWKTSSFYAAQPLHLPWAGFALPLIALVLRDRRAWLGAAMFWLMLVPMLPVPGRLQSVYCYEALSGFAIVIASAAQRSRTAWIAALLLLWVPWNYAQFRPRRSAALAEARENRAFIAVIERHAQAAPETRRFMYETLPPELPEWGLNGALQFLYRTHAPELRRLQTAADRQSAWPRPAVYLAWNQEKHEAAVISRDPGAAPPAWIAMSVETPLWWLAEGWYPLTHSYRWTAERATAILTRPAAARHFELTVHVGPDQARGVAVDLLLDGAPAGHARFDREGRHTVRWPLPPGAAGTAAVEFRVPLECTLRSREGRPMGIPIAAFGFVSE